MSFGAGHIMDMIKKVRQNRALRPSNRAKFKENYRNIYSDSYKKVKRPIFKVPKEKLIKIKKQVRESSEKERKKERIFNSISFLIGLISLILILVWIIRF